MEIQLGQIVSFKNLANKQKTGIVTKIDTAFNGIDTRYHLIDLNDKNLGYTTIKEKITTNLL